MLKLKRIFSGFCAILIAFSLTACTTSNAEKESEVTTTEVTVTNSSNGNNLIKETEDENVSGNTSKSERKVYTEGFDENTRALNLSYRKSAYILPTVRNIVQYNTEPSVPLEDVDISMSYSVIEYTEEEKNIYKIILEAVKNRENSIDIPRTTTVTMERLRELMVDMYFAEPEAYIIDMESLNFKVEVENSKYVLFGVSYDYAYSLEDIERWDSNIDILVEKLKSYIPEETSDYDLYLFLHDFIVYNVTYNEIESAHDDDIVGALIEGYGTCQSFAKAYTYLCKEFGLYATNINGLSGDVPHMWNAVYYCGDWFLVDVGMDNVDNNNVKDWAPHGFFGLSQKYLESAAHTFYDENDTYYLAYPECTSDAYYFYEKQGYGYKLSNPNDSESVAGELLYIIGEAFKTNPEMNYVEFTTNTESIKALRELYFYRDSTFIDNFGANLEAYLHNIGLREGMYVTNVAFVGQDWNNSVIIYIQFAY